MRSNFTHGEVSGQSFNVTECRKNKGTKKKEFYRGKERGAKGSKGKQGRRVEKRYKFGF